MWQFFSFIESYYQCIQMSCEHISCIRERIGHETGNVEIVIHERLRNLFNLCFILEFHQYREDVIKEFVSNYPQISDSIHSACAMTEFYHVNLLNIGILCY